MQFFDDDELQDANPEAELRKKCEKNPARITFGDTEATVNELDDLCRLMYKRHRVRTNKSAILRATIDFLLLDFKLNGDFSWIVMRLKAQARAN